MVSKHQEYVAPRTGETHGLFGIKFLKYHNMRDSDWTAEYLITQYEKLSNIFRKANNVADLQKEQDEIQSIERHKLLKKKVKDKREVLQILLKGDRQRTKNVLQDHPNYQRVYKNMQSYEVLEELNCQAFLKRKKLDKYMSERSDLMKEYEKQLIEVATFQETIRYYDIKEFKEERKTKQLLVELKNSETRTRAIQKLNSSYRKIIDQLLNDSRYYQPVLDALNADWNEQTMLVKQTYNIGQPAIENVKKLEKELKVLRKISKKEENERFEEIATNRKVLKEQPKVVKTLVRHDSDFSLLGTRYDRDTNSMTNLKTKVEDIDGTIKMLKGATLCGKPEEISAKVELQPEYNKQLQMKMAKREKVRDDVKEKEEIAKFVHDLLLDDLPQIYNDEKVNEILMLQKSLKMEKDKQNMHVDHMMKRGELSMTLRLALQHLLDVLRHVGTPDFFKSLEFPSVTLQLPVLQFNHSLPPPPMVIDTETRKLLVAVKSRAQLLMQHYQKEKMSGEIGDAMAQFQQAMIEDSIRVFRPHVPSFNFD